jgi:hypothetical protein
MESVEITLRNLRPQPVGTVNAAGFDRWRIQILEDLKRLEEIRSSAHKIEQRLRNMASFIEQQIPLISQEEGNKVIVNAGQFHWFLVKLEQRQEGMKAQLDPSDPFVSEIDPGLRKRIKSGWSLLKVPRAYQALVNRLNGRLRTSRAQSSKQRSPRKTRVVSSRHRSPARRGRPTH